MRERLQRHPAVALFDKIGVRAHKRKDFKQVVNLATKQEEATRNTAEDATAKPARPENLLRPLASDQLQVICM